MSTTATPRSQQHLNAIREVAPKLEDLSTKVLFGDVWERTELSKRDRSLVTIAALIAMNRVEVIPGHMRRALDNGVTKAEIGEVITHLAFYSGWPTAASAALIAHTLFESQKG